MGSGGQMSQREITDRINKYLLDITGKPVHEQKRGLSRQQRLVGIGTGQSPDFWWEGAISKPPDRPSFESQFVKQEAVQLPAPPGSPERLPRAPQIGIEISPRYRQMMERISDEVGHL